MPPSRRFGLLDAMVLIAAIAVAITIAIWSSASDLRLRVAPTGSRLDWVMAILADISYHGCEVLACLSLALLILAARRPRPPLRSLMGQPGGAALVIAVSAIAASAVLFVPSVYCDLKYPNEYTPISIRLSEELSTLRWSAGPFIAAIWLVQALSGQWRPQTHWIDRSGRLIGVLYLVLAFLNCVIQNVNHVQTTIMLMDTRSNLGPVSTLPPNMVDPFLDVVKDKKEKP